MSQTEEEIAQMIHRLGYLKDRVDNSRDSELAKVCMEAMRAKFAALCKDPIIALEVKTERKAA